QYNEEHGIVPKTIQKEVREVLDIGAVPTTPERRKLRLSQNEKQAMIQDLEKQMKEAARLLEFEYAAMLRDKIASLKGEKDD
ncbi:MAG: UvrB/UvrC motif-containing protein, partial [Clostridia bacterium]|nr:UvrB/UvrC motif-containing protein [Clostridia bacterium]